MEKTSLERNPQTHDSGEQIQMKMDNAMSPPQFKLDASGNGGSGGGSGSSGGLSPELNAQMSSAMGSDFSNVNIHADSSKASDAGALAYAQGNDVHFAPGQFKPDTQSGQELIGHELAHVAQQREGRVQANASVGGMAVNNDPQLEAEADSMGAMAAQMKPAAGFEGVSGGGSGSASSSAPAQKKEDPLKVKEGQVTFDSEGQDSGKYDTKVCHWPGGASGVTIGRGYDLGSRTAKGVLAHLNAAGITGAQATLLSTGAGLQGDAAGTWVKNNKAKVGAINHDQQKLLFEIVYAEMKKSVIDISEKKAAKDKYGDVDFDNLHHAIMEILVDLRYRGDYKPSTREWIQPFAVKNDLKGFASAIGNKRWMTEFGAPKDRFERRKAFMDAAVAGKTPTQTPTQAPATKDEPKKETGAPVAGNGNNSTTAIDSGTVTASSLNVRSGAGANFSKVGNALASGAKVQVYEKKDGWLRIGNGQWVSGDFVKLNGKTETKGETKPAGDTSKPVAEGTVTASQLNVRSTPSTDGKVVDTLKSGAKVTILSESNGWMKIGPDRWVSGKFVTKGTGSAPKAPTTGGAGGATGGNLVKPSWITVAEGENGTKEIVGSKHNPRVIEYHSTTGKFKDDETPWCSSFANWVMKQAGQATTNSAAALSWAKYGKKLTKPAYGSIAVFDYGGGKGHVGFVVGIDGKKIQVLGGNQGNMVKVSSFSISSVKNFVVPSDWEVPQANYTMGAIDKVEDNGGVANTR
ncbi:MAG TPA: TIGR02594 family protein [Bacteroidia bacterium]|nr:TIGR02594 family protein [Bacteroidia bacterium]